MALAPHIATSGMYERFGVGTTPNPWFNIANQFTPRNLHDVIKWSRYITVQSPTITEVIRKLSTYPITSFTFETRDEKLRDKYKEIAKSLDVKNKLCDAGFDHYTIGNTFLSIYFPIQRMLKCPNCKTEYNSKSAGFAKFARYEFAGVCPGCDTKQKFEVLDKKSRDIGSINLVKWSPEHVAVNHNPITGESEYYYTIPNDVKRKIMLGDRLFIDTIPWGFIEAVRDRKDFKFDKNNIFHLKNISMGSVLPGLGLPPIISMYSLVFYQAVLRKANEAIATDYLAPLRAVFPQGQSANGDPVVSMSLQGFARNVESALKKHKQDPNHILISPVPLGYQNLGGEGKSLLVSQEIDQAEKTMLMGLGVSLELLSGTTNWTSSTVGLRMLENTMHQYLSQINELTDWIFSKVAGYLNIDQVEVKLTPFKLTDDNSTKQLLFNILQAGQGSFSTVFESFGLDYNEELERRKEDLIAAAVKEEETKQEIELAKFSYNKNKLSDEETDSGYSNARNQAHDLAHQLADTAPDKRRAFIVQIIRKDESMANLVMSLLPLYGINPETLMSEDEAAEYASARGEVYSPQPQGQTQQDNATTSASGTTGAEPKQVSDPREAKKKGQELPGPKAVSEDGV